MILRKIAVSGAKWSIVGTIGSSLFQLIQISILTRFLPKEAFGLVAMALFVVQFTNVFVDMGMSSAILHHQNSSSKEYSSIYWLNIFISGFLYILLVLSSPYIAQFYEEPEIRMLLPVLGLNLLFVAMGRQHRTIMQKRFQFKEIALIDLISFFSGVVLAIILAIYEYGVYSLVFSTLTASLVSNALFLIQNLRQNSILLHFCLKEVRPFLRIGGFSMGSTLLDFFSRETDVLIIGKMLGAESLGLYSFLSKL
ncbi:oligosaccharide flippase family protein [Geofilum rubicundum]|uniref:Lipopolysaccharide biosynthesis protein WzxC n=1 Tax=Geofilum rubicundum JCM 15548 TaxID=1236989 RepID=A0A0E9LZ81_9BACT|nr:oligosaccharide flippase family protein [Geofilum rubicundum]GAO30613.1 lipopolysaccharide biosynthesis protein WzxC [Geofilum rubicundum JCM 15548]